MEDVNLCIIKGRLGSDAYVGKPMGNGRLMIRISIATGKERSGEKTTNWHTVHYWTGLASEIETLTEQLVKGATVLVQGAASSYKRQHKDFPLEVSVSYVDAASIQVLTLPAHERQRHGGQHEAYEDLTPDPEAPVTATPPTPEPEAQEVAPPTPAPPVRRVASPPKAAPPARRAQTPVRPISVPVTGMPMLEF